ncbi:MAG: ImmA/IrrE family metallo-endopeptidase [Gammaproteobacteria bacterium]|nr:ImmA/IrrE family metallo-endopeptidase [Gammaproteobacteria bacterium]
MFGERLRLARKKAGLSLRALVEQLEGRVSAQALGKYERGQMMPSSEVLLALCKVLEISPDYLFSDRVQALASVEFRKRARTSAKERYRVEAQVIDQVERYLAVEEILELPSHEWQEPFPAVRIESEEEAEALAEELRREWGLGEDPLPNMTELLEEQGLKVLLSDLPNNVSGLTCLVRRGQGHLPLPVVVVNKSHSLERRRLTLAHELGHRLLSDDSPVDEEKACHRFAAAFLVNKDHLIRKMGPHRNGLSYEELLGLKRYFRVSAAAFLLRLRDIGVIDQSTMTYVFQTVARSWRREEPDPLEVRGEHHEQPKRFERLCYRALAEHYISLSKAIELLKKPIVDIEEAIKGPDSAQANYCQ